MKSNICILVVDDEAMMCDLLQKILKREGYKVRTAPGGKEALEILATEEIDLVLSDMKMPQMNGFDLLKRIKAEHNDLSVIIMTAYGDTYTVKDALLLGADEYITKPFKSHEITLVVERAYWRLLTSRRQEQEDPA